MYDVPYDPERDGFAYPFEADTSYVPCKGCGTERMAANLTEGLCSQCNTRILREVEHHFQVEFNQWATRTNEGRFAVAYAAIERERGWAA